MWTTIFIVIIILIIIIILFTVCSLFYYFYKPSVKKYLKINIYDKLAKYKYNRLNNSEHINKNPLSLIKNDLLENNDDLLEDSYIIINKML